MTDYLTESGYLASAIARHNRAWRHTVTHPWAAAFEGLQSLANRHLARYKTRKARRAKMSTRSITHILTGGERSPTLCSIYRQCDGYPEGHGAELVKLLGKSRVVFGIRSGQDVPLAFNGIGCLAAWLVGALKKCIGNIYIHPAGSSGCGEEYTYRLWSENGDLYVSCDDGDDVLYEGPLAAWNPSDGGEET